MKEIMITSFDDVEAAAERRVPAAYENVNLVFGGKEVQLDLSTDNYNRLSEFLRPYMDAGTRAPKQAAVAGAKPRAGSRASRSTKRAVREWCKAENIMAKDNPKRFAYLTTTGKFYYPVWLMEQFEAQLIKQQQDHAA
jgi:hypothetical protein